MNPSQRADLYRNLKPNSLISITSHKGSHLPSNTEFINYKPIIYLDPPIEDEFLELKATHSLPVDSNDTRESLTPKAQVKVNKEYIQMSFKNFHKHIGCLHTLTCKRIFPFSFKKKKQLLLDLDETLIHTYIMPKKTREADVELYESQFISHRPFLKAFLKTISKYYDLIVFSSGQEQYVEDAIDTFDPFRKYIGGCLTYFDCLSYKGLRLKIIKGNIGIDPTKYVLIDDNIMNVLANRDNAILILPYNGDQKDTELNTLSDFLISKAEVEDIRSEITQIFSIDELIKFYSSDQRLELIGN